MSIGMAAPVSPRKRVRADVRWVRIVRRSNGGVEEEPIEKEGIEDDDGVEEILIIARKRILSIIIS